MWTVYLIRCKDNTLYTGITINLEARIQAHNRGKGAKYTRGRGPVNLVWLEKNLTQRDALKREREIKKLTRTQKNKLII
jgi:putative endonuclease